MPVEIESNEGEITRVASRLWSLDMALASRNEQNKIEPGFPLRAAYMIYGYEHVGKSTLSYYLAARVRAQGEVDVVDLEGLDKRYVKGVFNIGGFDGKVKIIPMIDKETGKLRMDAEMLEELADRMLEHEVISAGVFDSISSFASTQEREGEMGEAFMGRRAFDLGQFYRRVLRPLRASEKPKALFVVNHKYQKMGGMGHTTAGGQTPRNLSAIILHIQLDSFDELPDGRNITISRGEVKKLRFGGPGGLFRFAIVPNVGIHIGLTAMYDCIEEKLADRGTTLKLKGKSLGRISKLFDAAMEGKDSVFEPFEEALLKHTKGVILCQDEKEASATPKTHTSHSRGSQRTSRVRAGSRSTKR